MRFENINMLNDTMTIMDRGYYEVNGRRVKLKLSKKEMKESAKQDAIDNGLYVNAESNVKTLIKSFLYQTYDSENYEIVFK